MHRFLRTRLLLCIAALFFPALGSGKEFVVEHAVVSLVDEVQVRATTPGLLDSVPVEGDQVKSGATLVQQNDAEARMLLAIAQRELAAARRESENDIDVRYAIAAAEVAKAEHEAALETNARVPGTVVEAELRRLDLAKRRATLGIEQARHESQIAGIATEVKAAEVEAAELQVRRRIIAAPFSGVVVRVHRHANEWVGVGELICHVARLDRLRVTGFVNVEEYDQSQIIGRPALVHVTLTNGKTKQLDAKIGFVSPVVQAGGEYRMWAEVANTQQNGFWALRPGTVAKMTIDVAEPVSEP